MTRFRIGVKSGVGPVIKVMRDAADNPFTTPNTDWHKFVVNSEVQAIAYGAEGISHTYSPASYTWPSTLTPDKRYWPSEAAWVWRSESAANTNGSYLNLYFDLARISGGVLNAFHFIARGASDWAYNWRSAHTSYNAGDNYITIRRYYPSSYPASAVPSDQGVVYNPATSQWSVAPMAQTYGMQIWPSGRPGADNTETSGPNTRAYYTDRSFKFTYYRLDLPIDNSPYPAVSGTPVVGRKILRISPSDFRMAKPGFDLGTASTDQMLFSADKSPLKIIKTGVVSLGVGETASVALGGSYSASTLVDFQANVSGQPLFIPPMIPTSLIPTTLIAYRIVGQNLEFKNNSTTHAFDIRFFVMSADDLAPSAGSAKVFEAVDGGFVIRRPGSSGSRLRDIILDTRLPTIPVIAQGWIPFASMIASDVNYYGTHRAIVNIDPKGMKPYLLARLCRRLKADHNHHIFQDFGVKQPNVMSILSDSSFLARVTDTQVTFYCSDGSRTEDAYYVGSDPLPTPFPSNYETVGIRYYVFAVPASL